MGMPDMETMGLSATVARASVLSPESSQAQLLLQLLDVRQVMHCIPLDAHCLPSVPSRILCTVQLCYNMTVPFSRGVLSTDYHSERPQP